MARINEIRRKNIIPKITGLITLPRNIPIKNHKRLKGLKKFG